MVFLRIALFFLLIFSGFSRGVGVYFGTFDPPHAGHFQVIEIALKSLKLDVIYVLPNVEPTNKSLASGFLHRRRMVKKLQRKDLRIRTLDPERMESFYSANPTTYIEDILDYLKWRHSGSGLYHICGADSYLKMKSYQKLPSPDENRIVAVVERPGTILKEDPVDQELKTRGQLVFLKGSSTPYSSSSIRKRFSNSQLISSDELFPPIQKYIRLHKLYQKP